MKYFLATVAFFCAAAAASAETSNRYVQTNLIANDHAYKATIETDKKLINAWGIAIRPAGMGGHFWVTGKDTTFQYVGDVKASPDEALRTLHWDSIKHISLPVGGDDKFATGVVFSGSDRHFRITQQVDGAADINAPAKFLFASDGGIISAWTERKKPDGSFDWPMSALKVIDESARGVQFFGLAISHDYDRLYAADFGGAPGVKVYDGRFKPLALKFDAPFDDNRNGKVDAGEYAPFNIQALKTPAGENHLFVAYAKTMPCPSEEVAAGTCKEGEIFAGEEDISQPGLGRLAEFTEEGKLVHVWVDGQRMSAPWGLAFAPASFGKLADSLLVANFGDGTIAAYDASSRKFIDVMRDVDGKPIIIDKIWGLMFGNGASLGDADALYFAAGPRDEADGVFGSLRLAK